MKYVVMAILAVSAQAMAATEGDVLTFEGLAGPAARVASWESVVAPFSGDCGGSQRDIDKARCGVVQTFLRKDLPSRSFMAAIDRPGTVAVSDFDARVRGFRLRVAGCLVCDRPVGAGDKKRFVTLTEPAKGAASLGAAVEVAQASVSFKDVAESVAWAKSAKPFLRAEFVFQPSAKEWTLGDERGLAFKMLGVRVLNRCTGEVVFSQPPSWGPGDKAPDPACPASEAVAEVGTAGTDDGNENLPGDLAAEAINGAMAPIRADVRACFEQFRMHGTAFLNFEALGSGAAPAVALEGTVAGTAMGACILEAGRKVRFPRFRMQSQKFRYPVVNSKR